MSQWICAALVMLVTMLGGCGGGDTNKDSAKDPKKDAAKDGSKDGKKEGGKDSAKGNDTPKPKDRGTIGYSSLTDTNPFFVIIGDTMEAEAKKQGYDMIRVSGERDSNIQAAQIDEFITKGVAAIVINPCDAESVGTAIKKANDAGIPVFTNDLGYKGSEGKVVNHVATDNYQGGKLAGEAMVRAIGKDGGKVAILHFPQAESCQERMRGFNEVLDAHNKNAKDNKIKVVATLDGGGLRDEGFTAATNALEANADLAAIFAINDPSALGAYAALEEQKKVGEVIIIGFDGELAGKRLILEGKILCDPVQFPDQIAKLTIESIVKYFNGEDVEPVILIPSKLYYKEDAEKDPALKDDGDTDTTDPDAKEKKESNGTTAGENP